MSPSDNVMDKLVSLAKRRGFVFQSSEIYGGLGSVWDYGPLGVELKKNIKERWWRAMVHDREDIEGLDAAILMHPKVWEASGHVAGFTDPLVDCKHCKNRFRADDPRIKGTPGEPTAQCPVCGSKGTLTAPRMFNLMFKTFMGPVEEAAAVVYLRPETAQGIYVNYLNVLQSSRQKIPFGIAQIGKAFRNEITHGNFIFRTREFEQMEMQFFVKPGTDLEWFEFWRQERMKWLAGLGVARQAAVPPTCEGRAGPLRQGCLRHSVRVSLRLAGIRRDSQPDELRPVAAPGVLGEEARVFGCRDERALHSIRGRNVGGRRPHDARRDGGRVPRGRSARREAGGVALASRDRSTESRGVSVGEQGWDARAGAPHLRRSAEALQHLLRRRRLDRSPLSPPGRGRHAVRHHDRRSVHAGRHRDGARSGHTQADSRRGRPARRISGGAPAGLMLARNAERGTRNRIPSAGSAFPLPRSALGRGCAAG